MMNVTKRAAGGRRVLFINHTESNRRGKRHVDFFLLQGAETGHEEAVAQLGSAPKLIPQTPDHISGPKRPG